MSFSAGTVALIDNGGANVASVVHALERLGVNAERTASPERIAAADRVILPGVGAAADAMARLQASGLDRLLRRTEFRTDRGNPTVPDAEVALHRASA